MTFRIIADTIELDGVPVATILPSIWATKRDDLETCLWTYAPDKESTLEEQVAELEDQLAEAKHDNETLRDEKEELERQIDELEALP